MSEFPVFLLAMPAVAVAMLLFWTTVGKRMMRATDRRYADYQLAEVAQRMGLQVVEGDPSLNLIQAQTTHNMAAGQATGGGVETVLRKAGAHGVKARPEWDLPRQSFVDPDLDARLALTCSDPRIGPHLAPVVGALASQRYVHIQGQGRIISSLAEENATMYAAFELEQTQLVLEHVANALAGPGPR